MTIRGSLDTVMHSREHGWIWTGWAWDPGRPTETLTVRVLADGKLVARTRADVFRPDLAAAAIGGGRHGFVLTGGAFRPPPGGCSIVLEEASTGEPLSASPLPLKPLDEEGPDDAAANAAPGPALHGHVDEVAFDRLRGWAWYPDRPGEAVTVRILADGEPVARAVANAHRPDLERAGIGTGRYAFELTEATFKPPFGRCLISVEDEATGAPLQNSPVRLEPPLSLDGAAARAMAALFESPGSEEELRGRAAFAGGQAERLIQRLSDRRSRRVARTAQRARKWRWRPEDGPEPERLGPRALVIDNALPAAGRDAGSNAVLSHVASLRRLGYEVLFVPADMRDGPGVATLEAMGAECAVEPWSASVEEVIRREGAELDLVYFHRLDTAARYVPLAAHYLPRARRVYSVADLHHLRLARQAAVEERPELAAHAERVRGAELMAAASCHAVVTHSDAEAAMLRQALPRAVVEVVPWHFPVRPTPAGFAERAGLAFVGSYSHAPNLDGVLWLLDEIMPLVWQAAPEITCTLVGGDLPPTVMEGRDPRVRAVGRVPDLDAVLNRVRLTVAPLAFGAGLKGKVAESLAAGVPCACSTVAAEGFDLPPPLRALVAPDAAGLARIVARLHGDEETFAACREAGLAFVAGAFAEAVVDAGLRRAAGLPA